MSATAISLDTGLAVVGMSCRMADATSLDDFWRKLLAGHDSCREVPKDVFDPDKYCSPANKNANYTRVRIGNWLSDARWDFDAPFFGMTEAQALSLDPEQRLALTVTHEALDMAGYSKPMTEGSARLAAESSRVGVFFASTCDDYRENLLPEHVDERFYASIQRQFLAERIQRRWNFGGPAMVVDTVCSSSLVAMDLAATSIRLGQCDAAIVGGVNVITQPMPTIGLSTDHFLSETGTCKTFDESADGYSRGEAIGVLILKRLPDALRDCDNILSVLMSIGTNHSGESISLTFPHMPAQLALMRANLDVSGIDPRTVTLAEAHGTGTQAGDPCELEAISAAFIGDARDRSTLVVTTNKSNFGHSEASSGICSLIKAIVEIRTRVVPPHIGVRTKLNPALEHLARAPLHISLKEQGQVPLIEGQPFVTACVNNFGAAGGNTSLLLRGPSNVETRPNSDGTSKPQLIFVSAETPHAFASALQDLRAILSGQDSLADSLSPDASLEDIAYTTVARRPHYKYRKAFVACSLEDACKQLTVDQLACTAVSNKVPPQAVVCLSALDEATSATWHEELEGCATFRRAYQDYLLATKDSVPSNKHRTAIHHALCAVFVGWRVSVQLSNVFGTENDVRIDSLQELDTVSGQQSTGAGEATQPHDTDVKVSLVKEQDLLTQLLNFLKDVFEKGAPLDWTAVQADLNPDGRVCVMPTYPFDMKRHAIVYRDLGIVDKVWGENPIRVLSTREAEDGPLASLGLVSARQVQEANTLAAFLLQDDVANSDVLPIFAFAALAAVRQARQSMRGQHAVSLDSIVLRAATSATTTPVLRVKQTDPASMIASLTVAGSILAEASATIETSAQQDWETLVVFLNALRRDVASQKITKLVVKRLVCDETCIDGLAGTTISSDGRAAFLGDVAAESVFTVAQGISELLHNYNRLSPDVKKSKATIKRAMFTTDETGATAQRFDVYAFKATESNSRILLCANDTIYGEVILTYIEQGKGAARKTGPGNNAQAQNTSGRALDDGTDPKTQDDGTSMAALEAAASIIEAEVGINVTLPDNASTSFASLGVDSLMSLLLLDRMREVIPFELPRSLFFDYDDWQTLSTFLAGGESAEPCEEDTVVVQAGRGSIENRRENDSSSETGDSAALPPSTATNPGEASSAASSVQRNTASTIKSVSDVEGAVMLFDIVLGPGQSMRERNVTSATIQALQSQFVSPLPNALFRPDNTIDDVRSILVGPVHAASMVRRSTVLGARSGTKDQPIFLIPDGSGSAAVFSTIPQTKRTVYALNSPYLGDKAPKWNDGVIEIAAAYIYQIRERQPHGPYLFGGWSFGGIVSYEVARMLMADGEKVIGVLLLDAPCPQHLPPLPCEILEWGQKSSAAHGQEVQQFPPALMRHFEHAINSLWSYEPPPLLQDAIDRGARISDEHFPPAHLFTAADGIPVDPKLVPNSNITVEWLFGERKNLGPQGWDRLFTRVNVTDIPGTHFSMMEHRHASVWWSRVEETVDRWLKA